MAAGGLLMVIGAALYATVESWRGVTCWLFLAGALLFALMQSLQVYEGRSIVIRRLKRIQDLSCLFFVLAGLLMVNDAYLFLLPLFRGDYYVFLAYLYNKWVLLMLAAALLEMYVTLRLGKELGKDKKN